MNIKYFSLRFCFCFLFPILNHGYAFGEDVSTNSVIYTEEISGLQKALNKIQENSSMDSVSTEKTKIELINDLRSTEKKLTDKPIYEGDDRANYYDASPELKYAAQSTAVMVRNNDIIPLTKETVALPDRRIGLCPGERFSAEPAPGYCTAFRIGENILGTAGHCIQHQADCDSFSFVFGFRYNYQNDSPRMDIQKKNIFECKSIKARKLDKKSGEDWAIIEVDKTIPAEIPTVELATEVPPAAGANVTAIGYPSGLPVKIAKNGIVRKSNDYYFVATTDTFGGNSGSPVFDTDAIEKKGKLLVRGVLVRGENDYDIINGCRKTKICKKHECSGEDITHAKLLR